MASWAWFAWRWESGYWNTMDIAHDRAGYYLCWGCLNWVPAIYTSQPLFLANHPYQLPAPVALLIFLAGAACIYINYDCDRQRQVASTSIIVFLVFSDILSSNKSAEWWLEIPAILRDIAWAAHASQCSFRLDTLRQPYSYFLQWTPYWWDLAGVQSQKWECKDLGQEGWICRGQVWKREWHSRDIPSSYIRCVLRSVYQMSISCPDAGWRHPKIYN